DKHDRLAMLEDLQARVVGEINGQYLGQTVEVLVEEQHKGKWRGRTPQNKLVFFEDAGDWQGKLANVEIVWTGPWSMQGRLPNTQQTISEPLVVFAG
ncbi:MAG: TRAM domain-containing protein, partial [Anaerolineae bacterium]